MKRNALRDLAGRTFEPRCLWATVALYAICCASFILVTCFVAPADWHALFSDDPVPEEMLLDTFHRRFDRYWETQNHLGGVLRDYSMLVVIALFALLRPQRFMDVPGTKVRVPTEWLIIVLPLALTYSWFDFGFALNEAIDLRLSLWYTLNHLEPDATYQSYFSAKPLLRDHFFVDAWFVAFHPDVSGVREPELSILNRAILIGFAVYLGIGHGCIGLAGVRVATRRRSACGATLVCLLNLVVLVMILSSHFQFFYGGRHPNYAQHVIMGVGLLVLLFGFAVRPRPGADAARVPVVPGVVRSQEHNESEPKEESE